MGVFWHFLTIKSVISLAIFMAFHFTFLLVCQSVSTHYRDTLTHLHFYPRIWGVSTVVRQCGYTPPYRGGCVHHT